MSDPAVEAGYRALIAVSGGEWIRGEALILAAREALAPLRAKHQRVQRPDDSYRCTSCRDAYGSHADWPTGTDRLLYAEEELT